MKTSFRTWLVLTSVALLAAMVSGSAGAAVISRDWKTPGDGLITYDDENRREWLDLTESRLSTFAGATLLERHQSATAELDPGGMFEGFKIANVEDFIGLSESAGVVHQGTFAVNEIPTRSLIALVDAAATPSNTERILAVGALDGFPSSVERDRFARLIVAPNSGPDGTAGINTPDGIEPFEVPRLGIWLYRPVPEPTTLLTMALCVWAGGCAHPAARRVY